MMPKPVQKPRPPILIGGYVDRVLRRAGEDGDGWFTYFYTPESFTASWQKVREYARAAGRDPSELESTNQLPIIVGDSREDSSRGWASGCGRTGITRAGAIRRRRAQSSARLKIARSSCNATWRRGRSADPGSVPVRGEQVRLLAEEVIPRLQ